MASVVPRYLCSTCSDLNLHSTLASPQSRSVRYSPYTQFRLFRWRNAAQWSATCALCRLFRKASGNRDRDTNTPYALRFLSRSLINAYDWAVPSLEYMTVRGAYNKPDFDREDLLRKELSLIYIGITPDHEEDKCSTAELTSDVRRHGFISWHDTSGRISNSGRGRLLDPAKADLDLVGSWLDYCEKNHVKCRVGKARGVVEGFQLIDCSWNSIVTADSNAKYLALSYVWGRCASNPNDVSGRKLVVDNLPRTVSDAIVATRRLGFRYLWIDRYCIPEDPKIKHAQISMMDVVYQNAAATLIAVGGEDASHGLPGIHARGRTPQDVVQIGDIKLFTTLPHPEATIKESIWMTRGWTYQEAILSRRRIFFTDQQVYFECNGMQCLEALPPALDEWHLEDKISFISIVDRPIITVPTSSPGLLSLKVLTATYSRRKLSYDLDSLNAFLGVLAYYETLNPSIQHWWGIPISVRRDQSRPYQEAFNLFSRLRAPQGDAFQEAELYGTDRKATFSEPESSVEVEHRTWDPEHCFLNALLWTHGADRNKRRPEFPSWSWCGWEGSISGAAISDGYRGCNCNSEQRLPKIVRAYGDGGLWNSWHELMPVLSARRRALVRQPDAIMIEAITVNVQIAKVTKRQGQNEQLLDDGYYISRRLGDVKLRDGSLRDCDVFSRIHLSNPDDVSLHAIDNDIFMGLLLGCGENEGLLIVKPAPKGGCQRVGTVDIKRSSVFVGELTELSLMGNDGWGKLMKQWHSKDGYHFSSCSVDDIGSYISAGPRDTTLEDWNFKPLLLQSILT